MNVPEMQATYGFSEKKPIVKRREKNELLTIVRFKA